MDLLYVIPQSPIGFVGMRINNFVRLPPSPLTRAGLPPHMQAPPPNMMNMPPGMMSTIIQLVRLTHGVIQHHHLAFKATDNVP
ncbi:hypothetical protein EVAR_73325_1 [Eumeta japonica]|uniref:Uncharacterized protein n=1 Tax=Eumeta variegata TaxID=151549 RepID=A0A4C1TLW3_EUMVA|nr:hypothetical protein EVAR_73325_1 [Eumeta japonica]